MLRRKSLVIVVGIIILVISASFVLYGRYMIPVVMYHSVTPEAKPKNRMQISVNLFTRQMEFLKKHHYNVISLEEAAKLIRERKKIPAKTVAITFDDGYKDNYTYAYPILKKLGIPATIFIIINEVDRPQNDRLSWEEIKEMRLSGIITIGSHTLDHPLLTEVSSAAELKRQIVDSKKILEDKLKVEVDSFCYPAGRFDARIRELVVQAGYKFAVATSFGKNVSSQDVYLIKRVRVSESDNLFEFWVKTCGYYDSYRSNNHKRK